MRPALLMVAAILVGSSANATAGEMTPKEQAAARKIYVAKCAKCHKFYEPKNYEEAEWQRLMTTMSRKSKLKPNDKELLTRYLDDYRAGRIAELR